MKKIKYLLLVACALVILVPSCTMYHKAVPLTPINAQVNFDMDDLEYLGDVTGQSEQSYFLMLPYGGRKYYSASLMPQGLGLALPNNRGYNNALYDALQQKPDADLVLPVSFDVITYQQFMGHRDVLKVRFKAYKIKSK
ncbi:MAG: hypothetical protein IPP69_01100 [Flavobacteriales bacterium]|jgi:hypothetical protein|nr:hypothetical protein [Flavobacteriales bacterium]